MWSHEIENVLSSEKNFMGCFALDSLPSPVVSTTKTSLIINTSYSHEKGDHWVALVMNKNHCFYFDSFGLPVLSSEIFDFLNPIIRLVTLMYVYKTSTVFLVGNFVLHSSKM